MPLAVDSSTLIGYFNEESGEDIETLDEVIDSNELFLPPPVLTEILSTTKPYKDFEDDIRKLQLLPLKDGYWRRAGLTRQHVLKKGLKAKTVDSLIAQSCIDYDMPLLTRDSDFKHFAKHAGLKLYLG